MSRELTEFRTKILDAVLHRRNQRRALQKLQERQSQMAVESSASLVPPDPCQPELNAVGALLTQFDQFMDQWEPEFLDAMEALDCCRIAHPEFVPENP